MRTFPLYFPVLLISLLKHSSFERNEPTTLTAICELIATFMGESPEELAKMATQNTHRVFPGLGPNENAEEGDNS
jgi:Tat protein secretion system quality control protein TatD with DNase activity